MKIKVYLSCVVDLDNVENILPLSKISENMFNDEFLWDNIGCGQRVYARKCVVRNLEETDD